MTVGAEGGFLREPSLEQLVAEMAAVGCSRVHVLAWRDLDDAEAGGSEAHADEFMRRWAAAGLVITHRTSAAAGRSSTAVRNGYRVVRKGNRYTVFPRSVAHEIAASRSYDALVEVWNGLPWLTPLWSRKPCVTFLHHVHGPMWDQSLPKPLALLGHTVETRLAPPLYRRMLTLTPSEATRDELLELGFRSERVRAINNGVDERFVPGHRKADLPTVVCVGRLAPVKRQVELIDQAVLAKRRVPELQLIIVGDSPTRQLVEERIDAHQASAWIHLAGKLSHEELLPLYQQAWLVTSASLVEGWGLTLTEAAACGTPAVATDISGHRSSVVQGVTGELVALDRLGAAIADLLTDGARREALGAAALDRARTLTWDDTARGVLAGLHSQVMAKYRSATR